MKRYLGAIFIILSCAFQAKAEIRIELVSLFVDNQEQALLFYTEKLGFKKKNDVPLPGEYRWLTIVSPDNSNIELSLEPNILPMTRDFQTAKYEAQIPSIAFVVDDIQKIYDELNGAGVKFLAPPVNEFGIIRAIFDDNNGNYVMIYQNLK